MGWENPVKITPDSDVLIRAAVTVRDAASIDAIQGAQARSLLGDADLIAITAPALCEFVWVLLSVYKYSRTEIEQAIRTLSSAVSVVCDRQMVEFGLRVLDQGGDFADGVIASHSKGPRWRGRHSSALIGKQYGYCKRLGKTLGWLVKAIRTAERRVGFLCERFVLRSDAVNTRQRLKKRQQRL